MLARLLVLLALAASPAWATVKSCPSGSLTTAPLTATGPTPDQVIARASTALLLQATTTAGTATVAMEVSCDGVAWAPITGGAMSLASTALSQATSVLAPTCQYRANVTACAGCSVSVLFACSGP